MDFPAPATEGTLFAPPGGPQYVYTDGAWRMLGSAVPATGIVKISEGGPTGSVTSVDIFFPTGYKSYELDLFDIYTGGVVNLVCRFSMDGSTFAADAFYAWGTDRINSAASAGHTMQGSGTNTQTQILLWPLGTASSLLGSGHLKLFIAAAGAGVEPGLHWHGHWYNGADYLMIRGHGRYRGVTGAPKGIRIMGATGNIACASGWQLNGIK
jgi:hypothetical protein